MLPFRAFRMISRVMMPQLRLCSPLILTNHYLQLHNLNTFKLRLFLDMEEDEDEVISVNVEKCVVQQSRRQEENNE